MNKGRWTYEFYLGKRRIEFPINENEIDFWNEFLSLFPFITLRGFNFTPHKSRMIKLKAKWSPNVK